MKIGKESLLLSAVLYGCSGNDLKQQIPMQDVLEANNQMLDLSSAVRIYHPTNGENQTIDERLLAHVDGEYIVCPKVDSNISKITADQCQDLLEFTLENGTYFIDRTTLPEDSNLNLTTSANYLPSENTTQFFPWRFFRDFDSIEQFNFYPEVEAGAEVYSATPLVVAKGSSVFLYNGTKANYWIEAVRKGEDSINEEARGRFLSHGSLAKCDFDGNCLRFTVIPPKQLKVKRDY